MNNIIVISGPSGSGKTTLIRMLLKEHPEIAFSVSHTTRLPRGQEKDGQDYFFISQKQFQEMIAADGFIEWAKVHGNYYGTSMQEVIKRSQESPFLALDIDVQGARIVRGKLPNALFVLVTPPSIEALEKRILHREKTITPEFQRRIQMAIEELKAYKIYDYTVVNDILNDAFNVLNGIFLAYKNTTARNEALLKQIIEHKKI